MRAFSLFLVASAALVAVGCAGDSEECSIKIDVWEDADGDGFGGGDPRSVCIDDAENDDVVRGGDCDDTDASRRPNATWYLDADGDGFGDATAPRIACEPPPMHVANSSDCDDTDSELFPDVWYQDSDGDGFGDENAPPLQSCGPPPGISAVSEEKATDCNDADAAVFPGANETCDDGVDNDCDGVVDDAEDALWYPDLDGDGFGDEEGKPFFGCESVPDNYTQQGGDCDDTDKDLNPQDTPGCVQSHCGAITLDEVWKSTVAHRLTCTVTVGSAASPTLTIQAGSTMLMDPGTALNIGTQAGNAGRLVVDGDAAAASTTVIFTSSVEDTPSLDQYWRGLVIGQEDQGSELYGLVVEYAGNNTNGGVTLSKPGVENPVIVDGLTSRNNINNGLYIGAGEPQVLDSSFEGNSGAGVSVANLAGLALFQDNLIQGNDTPQLIVPGSHLHKVDLTNTIEDSLVQPEVEVISGTLRFEGTWYDHPGIVYEVRRNATISVKDGPQAHLTIESGVRIEFDENAGLEIGNGEEGRLSIGEGKDPVVFTGTPVVIARSTAWRGLQIGPQDDGSVLENLVVEYGGQNGSGNIRVTGSSPVITNVISRFSNSDGLLVTGDPTTTAPLIQDSEFVDNDNYGVNVASSSGIARSLKGPTFQNNVLTGNGISPAAIPANFLGELDPNNTFQGAIGDLLVVWGGTAREDAVWRKLDVDYKVMGNLSIGGPRDPVVTIEPEVTMFFASNTEFAVGRNDDGALIIDANQGGKSTWVTMTSADLVDPGQGDWQGLVIGSNGPAADETSIDGLTVQYAGGTVAGGGAIEVVDPNCATEEPLQTLHNVDILDSSKRALVMQKWTRLSLRNIRMNGALDGCVTVPVNGCAGPTLLEFSNIDCETGPEFGTWPIAQVDLLGDPDSSFAGPVIIGDGALSTDVTLPAIGVPYVFQTNLRVEGASDPMLTVGADVEVQFNSTAGLQVGLAAPGSLAIEPGALLRRRSTADWQGIRLGAQCGTIDIDGEATGATIEGAGANGNAAVWVDACQGATIDNVDISDATGCGIGLRLTDVVPGKGVTYTNTSPPTCDLP